MRRWGFDVLLALGLGLVFFALYAYHQLVWERRAVSWLDFFFAVGVTVAAYAILATAEALHRHRTNRKKALDGPSSLPEIARAIRDAYDGYLSDRTAQVSTQLAHEVRVQAALECNRSAFMIFLEVTDGGKLLAQPADFQKAIREWVQVEMKPRRWPCPASGVVVRTRMETKPALKDVLNMVDGKVHPPATLLWVVCFDPICKQALAVHLPTTGRMTACFKAGCRWLISQGFEVQEAQRPATALLSRISKSDERIPWWIKLLGP